MSSTEYTVNKYFWNTLVLSLLFLFTSNLDNRQTCHIFSGVTPNIMYSIVFTMTGNSDLDIYVVPAVFQSSKHWIAKVYGWSSQGPINLINA